MSGLGISNALGGTQVAEIKAAWGSTTLSSDWNPTAVAGQHLFPLMESLVNNGIASLQARKSDQDGPGRGVLLDAGRKRRGIDNLSERSHQFYLSRAVRLW